MFIDDLGVIVGRWPTALIRHIEWPDVARVDDDKEARRERWAEKLVTVREQALSVWMADHARVSFVEHPTPWTLEEQLISTLDLPLNLDQNRHHRFHAELGAQRRAAKTRAAALAILPR